MSPLLLTPLHSPSEPESCFKHSDVADGFHFSTYPSVYVVYKDISASGDCGIVGPTYASLTNSYAPSDIRTAVNTGGFGAVNLLNYDDLWSNCTSLQPKSYSPPACAATLGGTAGQTSDPAASAACMSQINKLESMQELDQIHCHPFIAYPSGLQSVNPAWSSCHAGNFASVFDPPRTLSPVSAMGPGPTKPPDPGQSATPAPVVAQPAPSKTPPPNTPLAVTGQGIDPPGANKEDSPTSSGDPSSSGDSSITDPPPSIPSPVSRPGNNPPGTHKQDLSSSGDPSSLGDSSIADSPPKQASANDPPPSVPSVVRGPKNDSPSANKQDPSSSGDSSTTHSPPSQDPASDPPQPARPSYANSVSGGQGISINAINPGSVIVVGSTIAASAIVVQVLPASATTLVITAAGYPVTVLPNGNVLIAGTTLAPNAPAVTIAGTPVSVGSNGLVVGTSTFITSSLVAALPLTAAGQPVNPLPNGNVLIAGTTLTPNTPLITIAGTRVSFGTNGLVIGTSTVPLSSLPLPSTITVAGQTFPITQVVNGVVLAGTTLKLGQSAMISGTPVTLGSSGLVVGTSTIPLQSVGSALANANGNNIGNGNDNGIGRFILSGINGGLAAPSATGSANSNQSQTNGTGAAGGTEAFLGGSSKVDVRRGVVTVLGMAMLLPLLSVSIC